MTIRLISEYERDGPLERAPANAGMRQEQIIKSLAILSISTSRYIYDVAQ
jgi:hypothetical protein